MKKDQQSPEVKRLLRKANKLANPLALLLQEDPEKGSIRTASGDDLAIEASWATHLDDATTKWVLDLFARNMRQLYLKSQWGYDETAKKQELQATTARYLIATSAGKTKSSSTAAEDAENSKKAVPVAYVHYRFVAEGAHPVLYCYEIQVEPSWQSKGIGGIFLRRLYEIAAKTGMAKVMATVFNYNTSSLAFFRRNGFDTDEEENPSEESELDYCILSRKTKKM